MNTDATKIIGLKVDGIRKLTAVEMEFAPNGLTIIKGRNKQGKTSVIDTIHWLISGNKVINGKIINEDKEKANGELQLGNYLIKRTLGKTPKLEVRNIDTNAPLKGEVQNFLDAFINELTFDPRPFLNKTPYQMLQFALDLFRDKLEAKSKEVLGYGFAGIDTELQKLEQERLDTGREVKRFGEIILPEKVEFVDVVELNAKRKEIEERNEGKLTEWESAKQAELDEIESFNKAQRAIAVTKKDIGKELDDTEEQLKTIKNDIADLELRLKAKKELLRTRLEFQNIKIKEYENIPIALPEKPLVTTVSKPELESTESIDQQIAESKAVNVKAQAYQEAKNKQKEKAAKQSEYESLDDEIKSLRGKKLEILRSIDTGVQGLEIQEDGLYYNGTYSQNWSDAEGLMISSEICIAQMPKLKAIFLDRAESLDGDSLRMLDGWAKEKDIQAFLTIVEQEPIENIVDAFFTIEEGGVILTDKSYEVEE